MMRGAKFVVEVTLDDDADGEEVAGNLLNWLCAAYGWPDELDRDIHSFDDVSFIRKWP